MPTYKAILFDLGNTLLYFDGQWPEVIMRADRSLLAALQAQGLDLDPEKFVGEFRARLNAYFIERDSEFIEHTTAYILQNLLQEWGFSLLNEDNLEIALREMYTISQSHWHVEADTLETLERLQNAGYHMGIVSNASDDADVQALVDKAGIRGYFDYVLSSAACGIRKPNPTIFEIGMGHWGTIKPKEAVMVGDTLGADILGAKNAGLFSVWITRQADKPGNRDHLDTIQPDATITTLAELPQLLNSLND